MLQKFTFSVTYLRLFHCEEYRHWKNDVM